mmetsp:Transcript_21149/g.33961  ORF Transcript_21149/g.33961 Transcript_21149/m.33961 type:complete len:145 (-) Transcript_21149:243-677(-)|eukprot:CAMPEP_0202690734 /NCGR_PEP_ID=MMETSP1385-20130828/5641_1 /ASSEMBLY_ACC=CAM_ASM_000861 /TAXON_ID=933848 /ORGANISM="Elphidium margaritaceum" /LENGTH=144 /DNA_ID=CAMNT_0049346025 /DNA_START=97 /DNA_END=531 /DNA_ORIENTATION=-
MNGAFSRVLARAQQIGVYRSVSRSSRSSLLRTQIRSKHYQDWAKHPLNNKYVFFDFAGELQRRPPMIIPFICKFLDNYIFRSSPAFATFVILMAWFTESTFERVTDWFWFRSNKGRLFTPDVLDQFPPEEEEEEDDDDDDEDDD